MKNDEEALFKIRRLLGWLINRIDRAGRVE